MAESKGGPVIQLPEKVRIARTPRATDTITIPKRRSSLPKPRSGNSLHDALQSSLAVKQEHGLVTPPQTPDSSVEDVIKEFAELKLVSSKPRKIDQTSVKNAPFTPPTDGSGADTPDVSASKALVPFPECQRKYDFLTPTKRRTRSGGPVINTPPASTDRYIPGRCHVNTASSNFRANKPMFELTPEQKQMRLDGATPDPFMARRVTPQFNNRRNSGSSRLSNPRSVSAGAVWGVGGPSLSHGPMVGVDVGHGIVLGSGTNARMFSSNFYDRETAKESHDRFEGRLAMALDLDRAGKVLDFSCSLAIKQDTPKPNKTEWKDGQWTTNKIRNGETVTTNSKIISCYSCNPFQIVLDAPSLKDDFYCSLLAYCPAAHCLAVALKNRVYLWSEDSGVVPVARPDANRPDCYITSLSFSNPGVGRSILAIGRSDGRINLWQIRELADRIQHNLARPVACLAFKPVSTRRFSNRMNAATSTEELLVGDEAGSIFYYSIEWPTIESSGQSTAMSLMAKIALHKQQVCGLAWSPDGELFASGGNDNVCYLVAVKDILDTGTRRERRLNSQGICQVGMSPHAPMYIPHQNAHNILAGSLPPYTSGTIKRVTFTPVSNNPVWPLLVGPDQARHCWHHAAAIKAIAFCPWQPGLIATGGGSNDRAIHFFHTRSGACLATIDVHAQVTSLIWSTTRKEICATFSYAQPDHPYRIAVFSWPECQQVVRIAWHGNIRALYAIPYPGGPNEESLATRTNRKGKTRQRNREGGTWYSRTKEEGCIVVASSDESVKFHEIWARSSQGMGSTSGGLAWSRILESEEGGDVEFAKMDIIR